MRSVHKILVGDYSAITTILLTDLIRHVSQFSVLRGSCLAFGVLRGSCLARRVPIYNDQSCYLLTGSFQLNSDLMCGNSSEGPSQ